MRHFTRSLAPFALLALIAMCGFAALSTRQQPYDYAAEQAKLHELQRQQQDDEATAPARQLGISLLWVAAGAIPLAGSAVLIGNWYADRKRKRQLLTPTREGLYPIPDPIQLARAMETITQPLAQQIATHITATLYAGQMTASIAAQYPAPRQLAYAQPAAEQPAPALPPAEAAPITLPEQAALAEHLPGRGRLVYGVLPGGQTLTLPLAAGYHMLAHGDTRSGKTNWIDGMIVQLHHQAEHYDLDIIAGDFKRELAATWRRSPLLSTVETDPQAIAEQLEHIVHGKDGILQRYSAFEALGTEHNRIVRNMGDYVKVTGERPRLRFVIIDEINALLEACSKSTRLAPVLKQVLQTGAGAGVYILGGAQYLSAQVFGRDGSKQFVTRAHFGAYDQNAVKVMFSNQLQLETRELITGQPGRGLIRTVGQSQPQAFQALRCEEADILEAIDIVRGRRSPGEAAIIDIDPTPPRASSGGSVTTSTSSESAVQAGSDGSETSSETPSAELLNFASSASESPELTINPVQQVAEIVQRLRAEGRGKNAIIELVWGAKPGGSKAYREASNAYDRIVGDSPDRGGVI